MSSQSGTEVRTGSRYTPPPTDLDRLLTYMEQQFLVRRAELLELLGEVEQMKTQGDLVKLGVRSLRLAFELDTWVEIARDSIDRVRGDELATSRDLVAGANGGRRPLSDEVKAQAAAQISPLTTIYNLLKSTRDRAMATNRWCQVQQQTLRAMEFGEIFEQDADLTPMFDAPLDDTISRARSAA